MARKGSNQGRLMPLVNETLVMDFEAAAPAFCPKDGKAVAEGKLLCWPCWMESQFRQEGVNGYE